MAQIHPSAVVDAKAEIGADVAIGPFCIVESGVTIGDGTVLAAHVYLQTGTTLGQHNQVGYGAVLGGEAQHRQALGITSYLVIGDRNNIREYVTMHRASHPDAATVVGDDNMFMASSHLGHDVTVGDRCTFANLATAAGHCQIGDGAIISGLSALHQRVTVGTLAMIGGMTGVSRDVAPFSMVAGTPPRFGGHNKVGLERAGYTREQRERIAHVLRKLYFRNPNLEEALANQEAAYPDPPPEVRTVLEFARAQQAGKNGRQLEH